MKSEEKKSFSKKMFIPELYVMFASNGKCFNHLGNLTNFIFLLKHKTRSKATHILLCFHIIVLLLCLCYSQLAHCIVLERFEKQDVRRLKSYKLLSLFLVRRGEGIECGYKVYPVNRRKFIRFIMIAPQFFIKGFSL